MVNSLVISSLFHRFEFCDPDLTLHSHFNLMWFRKCRNTWESVWVKYQSCSWCCTSRKDMSLGNWYSGDFFTENFVLFCFHGKILGIEVHFKKACRSVCLRGFWMSCLEEFCCFCWYWDVNVMLQSDNWNIPFILFLDEYKRNIFWDFSLFLSSCFCCEWWVMDWNVNRVVNR
jgi:hypothetical protein